MFVKNPQRNTTHNMFIIRWISVVYGEVNWLAYYIFYNMLKYQGLHTTPTEIKLVSLWDPETLRDIRRDLFGRR